MACRTHGRYTPPAKQKIQYPGHPAPKLRPQAPSPARTRAAGTTSGPTSARTQSPPRPAPRPHRILIVSTRPTAQRSTHIRRQGPRALQLVLQQRHGEPDDLTHVLRGAPPGEAGQRRGIPVAEVKVHDGVVLQVRADAGEVSDGRDVVCGEVRCRSDAREHKDLGSVSWVMGARTEGLPAECAQRRRWTVIQWVMSGVIEDNQLDARDDDLPARLHLECVAVRARELYASSTRRAVGAGTARIEQNAGDTGLGEDLEVRASEHVRREIRGLGRDAPAAGVDERHCPGSTAGSSGAVYHASAKQVDSLAWRQRYGAGFEWRPWRTKMKGSTHLARPERSLERIEIHAARDAYPVACLKEVPRVCGRVAEVPDCPPRRAGTSALSSRGNIEGHGTKGAHCGRAPRTRGARRRRTSTARSGGISRTS